MQKKRHKHCPKSLSPLPPVPHECCVVDGHTRPSIFSVGPLSSTRTQRLMDTLSIVSWFCFGVHRKLPVSGLATRRYGSRAKRRFTEGTTSSATKSVFASFRRNSDEHVYCDRFSIACRWFESPLGKSETSRCVHLRQESLEDN